MRGILFAILIFGISIPAVAVNPTIDYANTQLADPVKERQAKALMETIRCVVCQGQSIADSNAGLAMDMRGVIRERIENGEEPETVRAWLIEHYGPWVSFKPSFGPATALLWIIPLLAAGIGLFLARGRFRRKKR